jgi:hypothetical protein
MNRDQVNQDGGIVSLDELSRIADMTGILFPNVSAVGSKGKLKAGDTLALADGYLFSAGSAIGFFLIQNAWNGSGIRGWNSTGGNPLVFYSWDHINPEAPAGATYSRPGPNTRHVAMQFASPNASEVIMSFEDLHRNRNSDEDFNDAVFMVWSDSDSALSQSRLAGTVPEPGTLMLMLLGISVFAFSTRGSSPG